MWKANFEVDLNLTWNCLNCEMIHSSTMEVGDTTDGFRPSVISIADSGWVMLARFRPITSCYVCMCAWVRNRSNNEEKIMQRYKTLQWNFSKADTIGQWSIIWVSSIQGLASMHCYACSTWCNTSLTFNLHVPCTNLRYYRPHTQDWKLVTCAHRTLGNQPWTTCYLIHELWRNTK